MKNIIYVGLALLVLTSCQETKKIAFIDNGVVINDFQEKKDIETRFQERSNAFQKRRDSLVNAYQLELKAAQVKAQKMSPANLKKLSHEIQQKEQLLGQKIQLEQQAIQQEFQSQLDSVIVKVKAYVKDYGAANGYTYILGTSDAASTVLYGAEENDLTKVVLEALNANYKK